MPRKPTEAALLAIVQELIEQFVTGSMSAEAAHAASRAFKNALIEHALRAELSNHISRFPGAAKPEGVSKHCNGASGKTVFTDDGSLRNEVPRHREGSFELPLIPMHERRFTGFDDKIPAHVCARHDDARDARLSGRAAQRGGFA